MLDDEAAASIIPYLQAGIGGPAAAALADMGSIAADLAFTRRSASRYADMASAEALADPLVAQALWNGAAIAYRRAFGSGKSLLLAGESRLRLDRAQVAVHPGLSEGQRFAHTLTLQLADKHVAHRVGDTEDARAVVFLAPPPQQRRVEGVGMFFASMIGPDPLEAMRLTEVCDLLLEIIQAQIEDQRQKLLDALTADQDVDRFYDHVENT